MFRIDDATAAPSLPTPEAAGSEGYFTEGNPTAGTPATNVRGSWLNMIQEELRAIVVAGGLTPSKTTYTQVRDAIAAFVGPGRYLGTQVIVASQTYTPGVYNGATAKKSVLRGVAAGGGSGGVIATSGNASANAASAGGNAGNQFAFVLNPLPASLAITIGAAGTAGAAGANGGNGGDIVIGSLATIKGGKGSGAGNASTTYPSVSNPTFQNTASTISGTGVTVLLNLLGEAGRRSVLLANGTVSYGDGGSSPYGARGTIDQAAAGYGAGACGIAIPGNTAAAAGNAGTPSILIIDEYA